MSQVNKYTGVSSSTFPDPRFKLTHQLEPRFNKSLLAS